MKYLTFKLASWLRGKDISNPVYDFFVNRSSGDKKKAYSRALEAAQNDQREIIERYEILNSR